MPLCGVCEVLSVVEEHAINAADNADTDKILRNVFFMFEASRYDCL
ncbi:hypothetical protein HMPREF1563_0560 [Providencia alcalifaciens 205/92]|uniref:Uncharacterized protein n=1 Tax=Providencia alcalifaciens 205/92 TaxID=1256988 RepID=A0AAV3M2D9_9GAMM|nr:hypothetical protein HMPREF1563_0560 [Providencia alcalifaciens 205/92]